MKFYVTGPGCRLSGSQKALLPPQALSASLSVVWSVSELMLALGRPFRRRSLVQKAHTLGVSLSLARGQPALQRVQRDIVLQSGSDHLVRQQDRSRFRAGQKPIAAVQQKICFLSSSQPRGTWALCVVYRTDPEATSFFLLTHERLLLGLRSSGDLSSHFLFCLLLTCRAVPQVLRSLEVIGNGSV